MNTKLQFSNLAFLKSTNLLVVANVFCFVLVFMGIGFIDNFRDLIFHYFCKSLNLSAEAIVNNARFLCFIVNNALSEFADVR